VGVPLMSRDGPIYKGFDFKWGPHIPEYLDYGEQNEQGSHLTPRELHSEIGQLSKQGFAIDVVTFCAHDRLNELGNFQR